MSAMGQAMNEQKWQMMAMNKLLLYSNEIKDLFDLNSLLEESIGLWSQNLYFISVYEQFMKNDIDDGEPQFVTDDSCIPLLRYQDFTNMSDKTPFKEELIMPDLQEVFRFDSGYDMFMIRLLHTKSALYGYILEGIRGVDERCMRR